MMKNYDDFKAFKIESNAAMSDKIEALMGRTKKVYGKILTGVLSDSFEYMSSEDVEMIQECMEIMNEGMELSIEVVRASEENSRRLKEIEDILKENNRYLKNLDKKRDEREA